MSELKTFQRLSAGLGQDAVQRTRRQDTRKAYDTDGYGYQWVADRLNEVLGVWGWSVFESESRVTPYKTRNGKAMFSAVTRVTIQINTLLGTPGNSSSSVYPRAASREMWGGHDSITEADALKGSFTNGFKKCAALLGVGADAYRGNLDPDNEPKAEDEAPRTADDVPPEIAKMSVDAVRAEMQRYQEALSPAVYRALVPEEPKTLREAREALHVLRDAFEADGEANR